MNARIFLICLQALCAARIALAAAPSLIESVPAGPVSQAFFQIPQSLKQLSVQDERVRAELDTLPHLNDALQFEAYGYHGGYLPKLDKLPELPRWTIEFTFRSYFSASKIILVPAVDHRFGRLGSYGFPLRFRVLVIDFDGSSRIVQEWMDEDCPDPERYPCIIDVPPRQVGRKIRIEVFRGAEDGGRELFALDELFGVMGNMDHECSLVEASSSYESPPYWGKDFVIDHRTSLGLPLDVRDAGRPEMPGKDFAVSFDLPPERGCVVEFDLGQDRKLGWITLFPAQSPEGIVIPGYGFPGDINLDLIKEVPGGGRGEVRHIPRKWGETKPGNNVVRLQGSDLTGRWIRMSFDKFPTHNGRPTFALGEILVHRLEQTYPIQSIKLEGFPLDAERNVHLLHDGKAGGYPVLSLLDWLQQIERRKQLSSVREELNENSHLLQMRWDGCWRTVRISVIVLLAAIAALVAVVEVVQRRRSVKQLKWRITRDLHDEVGSSLGSISLTAERLETDVKEAAVKEDLADLSLLAREAAASLRDVVWMVDQSRIRLPVLLQKLVSRAERVLSGVELSVDLSADFPDQVVPLNFKRHLVMFFKEVIHNCARHSEAAHVDVMIHLEEEQLVLSVRDDGCGFDSTQVVDGWGLDSLKKRAKELGGEMELQTAVDLGTRITLTVPMVVLFSNKDYHYKTSN